MLTHFSKLSLFFTDIVEYREYLEQSVRRDLRNKYKRSVLGYCWTVLHPLAMMSVLAVVFSSIMRMPVKDYAVFLFAGLLPWNYFNSTAMMSLGSIRHNARIFGQMAVPKYLFILSISFSNLVNLLLSVIPLVLIMLVLGRPITWTALAFPMVVVPLFCLTMGIALILATSNVFFDDTLHLAEVGMSALYFLCPIIYHRGLLPARIVDYLAANPLFVQIEFFRGLFYEGVLPDPTQYALNCLASVLVLLLGLTLFKSSEDRFLYFV